VTIDFRLLVSVAFAVLAAGLLSLTSGRISFATPFEALLVPALIGAACGIGAFAAWPAFIGWYCGVDPLDAEVTS
jgi:hypothetical protein